MYSTINGAKDCASNLHKFLKNCGFALPLNKSQHAIARAGGFREWHDLLKTLLAMERPCDPARFRRRLIAALPQPCRAPAYAWLDREAKDEAFGSNIPQGWYRYVFPYVFAVAVRHRHSPAIRRGSGAGQRLRESMICGVLLNVKGDDKSYPRLDPDTLDCIYEGTVQSVFGESAVHPRFGRELRALQDAAIIQFRENQVIIRPPDVNGILDKVLAQQIDKINYFAIEPGYLEDAVEALCAALEIIGIPDARHVADALLKYGSDAYSHRSGPLQDVLSDLAATGHIQAFAQFYGLVSVVWPQDAQLLQDVVPAKILNQYFARYLGFSGTRQLFKFTNDHPDWADNLKSTLMAPSRFEQTVNEMAGEIQLVA